MAILIKYFVLNIFLIYLCFSTYAQNGHICDHSSKIDIKSILKTKVDNKQKYSKLTNINYQSSSTSKYVIYLDFDGEYLANSWWGKNINALPASYFSNQDRLNICKVMTADFQPFDVNITTNRSVYNAAEGSKKVHVIFTPTDHFRPDVLGTAEKFSFSWKDSPEIWVFNDKNGYYAGNTASHEVGHTLGLSHDGKENQEYYIGHGDWGPIMGYGTKEMCQWSNGDYSNATQEQDDINIIASTIPFREDDWNSSLQFPSELGQILTNNTFSENALISQAEDKDIFMFSTLGGNIKVNFAPINKGYFNNLRLEGSILDKDGNIVISDVTDNTTKGILNVNLQAGIYYLQFNGVGIPQTNGYSDYGSIGKYHFSGNIVGYTNTTDIGVKIIRSTFKETCDKNINALIEITNYGSTTINSYGLLIYDKGGDITSQKITQPLNPYKIDTIEVAFTPKYSGTYIYQIKASHPNDLLLDNNESISNEITYLYGNKILFEISQQEKFYSGWDWNVKNINNKKVIISSSDFVKVTTKEKIQQEFCIPNDSCFEFNIIAPFYTEWCESIYYAKYDLLMGGFTFGHIFKAGDTIRPPVIIGKKSELYQFQQAIAYDTLLMNLETYLGDPAILKSLGSYCTIPSNKNPYFHFTNLSNNEEIFRSNYIDNQTMLTKEVCFEELVTNISDIDTDFNIYPNPTNDIVYWNINQSFIITNIFGKTIWKGEGNQFDFSDQLNGVYFIKTIQGVFKVIKQ